MIDNGFACKIMRKEIILILLTSLFFGRLGYCLDLSRYGLLDDDLKGAKIPYYDSGSRPQLRYCFQYNDNDEKMQDSISCSPYSRKEPLTAFAVALFPGFFVHGAGHFYAGDKKMATGLLVAEIASLPFLAVSFYDALAQMDGGESPIPQTVSISCGLIGTALFLGSWCVDVAAAPTKTAEMNRKHGYSLLFHPKIGKRSISLNVAMEF
jgi:hypothetical protein